jgi:hypothetical protein
MKYGRGQQDEGGVIRDLGNVCFMHKAQVYAFGNLRVATSAVQYPSLAALAAGLGAMCLCTLLVSHASQRTTLVADDFAWNRGSLLCCFVSGLFARSEIYRSVIVCQT